MKKPFHYVMYSLVGVALLGLLAFQYAIIAHFPIGDDPAVHIRTIRYSTYSDLLRIYYPIPLIIFKWLAELLTISIPRLFTFIISGFLFLSTVAYFFFIKKISGSVIIAYASALIFVTGVWVNDGLRMGLLPESLGWGVLIIALAALSMTNITLSLITAFALLYTHPISFLVYIIVTLMYLPLLFFSKERQERRFALLMSLVFLVVFILVKLTDPTLISRFFNFVNPEVIGWGERPLWVVLTNGDPRRALIAVASLAGVIVCLREWHKPGVKLLYLLLGTGLFLSMNQIFGIRFLVFRFFPYLEMGLSAFTVFGIAFFLKQIGLNNKYSNIFLIVIAFVVLFPSYHDNMKISSAQANLASMDNSMTTGDQEAIRWIGQNLAADSSINATHKRAIWIKALTELQNVSESPLPYNQEEATKTDQFDYDYIYYSSIEKIVPEEVLETYHLVYDKNEVKIFEK